LEEQKAGLVEMEMLNAALGKADDKKKAKLSGRIDRLEQQKSQISEKIAIDGKKNDGEKLKN